MFRQSAFFLAAAAAASTTGGDFPLRGYKKFSKEHFGEHKEAVKAAHGDLSSQALFSKTRDAVYESWKKLSTEDRISQGYWEKLEGEELERVKALSLKKQEAREEAKKAEVAARAPAMAAKKKSTPAAASTSSAPSSAKKKELSGAYKFMKDKFHEHQAKVKEANPELISSKVFKMTTNAVFDSWRKLSKEDRIAQGYWTPMKRSSTPAGEAATESKKEKKVKLTDEQLSPMNRYTRHHFQDHKAKVKAANPELGMAELFAATKRSVLQEWKALAPEERLAQGYGPATVPIEGAKKKKTLEGEPLSGSYKFMKVKYPEFKVKVLEANPELEGKELFHKTRSAVQDAWKALPVEERVAEYGEERAAKE